MTDEIETCLRRIDDKLDALLALARPEAVSVEAEVLTFDPGVARMPERPAPINCGATIREPTQ